MYIAQLGRVAFPNAQLKDVSATGTVKNGVDYTVSATVTYDRSSKNASGSRDDVGDGLLQMSLTGAANTEELCVSRMGEAQTCERGKGIFHVCV